MQQASKIPVTREDGKIVARIPVGDKVLRLRLSPEDALQFSNDLGESALSEQGEVQEGFWDALRAKLGFRDA